MSSLIVSDSSPLHILIRIGQSGVLPLLYDRVLIPPAVSSELQHPKAGSDVIGFMANRPTWLQIQPPTTSLSIPRLDAGETQAISLALELGAVMLIDERDGRDEAVARGLRVVGAVGVLERAADAGIIADLAVVHSQLRATHFRVSSALLDASLAAHRARSPKRS